MFTRIDYNLPLAHFFSFCRPLKGENINLLNIQNLDCRFDSFIFFFCFLSVCFLIQDTFKGVSGHSIFKVSSRLFLEPNHYVSYGVEQEAAVLSTLCFSGIILVSFKTKKCLYIQRNIIQIMK